MINPMRITAIKPDARKKDLLAIKVSGRTVATLSPSQVVELGLKVDQTWNEQLSLRVQQADRYTNAMRAAMSRLNRKAFSTYQLDRKLAELGHDQAARTQVLDRLTEIGLLNDESVGRAIIHNTARGRGTGPKLLKQKLYRKGLHAQLIDRLVSEYTSDYDQTAQAVALAKQKLAKSDKTDNLTVKRRLYSLLLRRGFDSDTINAAMQELDPELTGGDTSPL